MSKKLFVGSLPFNYTDEELRALFAAAGTVLTAVMVQDPAHGRTRGFGFVAMSKPEENLAAIQQLNGMKVGEKNIYVTEAREKKPEPPAARPPRPDAARRPKWDPRPARFEGKRSFSGPRRDNDRRPMKWEQRGPRSEGNRGFSAPRPDNPRRPTKWEPRAPRSDNPRRPLKWEPRAPRSEGRRPFSGSRPDKPSRRFDSKPAAPRKPGFWKKFEKKDPTR